MRYQKEGFDSFADLGTEHQDIPTLLANDLPLKNFPSFYTFSFFHQVHGKLMEVHEIIFLHSKNAIYLWRAFKGFSINTHVDRSRSLGAA